MKIEFTTPTQSDYQSFSESGLDSSCLDDKIKMIIQDDKGHEATLFIQSPIVERLGHEYIKEHTTIFYSKRLGQWFAELSENDYHNDPKRNPEKKIPVVFIGINSSDGAEIYQAPESGYYYLRRVVSRKSIAYWLACGKEVPPIDGGNPMKPNLIFVCDGQTEKIRYDDWDGVAAYSDTFNPNFRGEKAPDFPHI